MQYAFAKLKAYSRATKAPGKEGCGEDRAKTVMVRPGTEARDSTLATGAVAPDHHTL